VSPGRISVMAQARHPRSPARTGKAMSFVPNFRSPHLMRVNWRACRFGRYKYPRRPHPPPRASRVSQHPLLVSDRGLAHPCSPTLTYPDPPPSARPIDSLRGGPFWAPWPRRPKWAPTTVPFLGGTAYEGKSTLNMALTSRSHLPFSLSPSAISLAVRCRPRWFLLPSAAIPILRFAVALHPPRAVHAPLPPLPILSIRLLRGAMGRRRTAEDCQRTAEENGWVPGPMKRRMLHLSRV